MTWAEKTDAEKAEALAELRAEATAQGKRLGAALTEELIDRGCPWQFVVTISVHPRELPGDLNGQEKFLLDWLSREDFNSLGECNGPTLDGLVARGLAQIAPPPDGKHHLYSTVSLTDAGWAEHKKARAPA